MKTSNNPSPMMEVGLIAVAGALVWWYFSKQSASAATTQPATGTTPVTTQPTTQPAQSTTQPSTTTQTTTTTSPGSGSATTAPTNPYTLSQIYQNLQNTIASGGDPAITGTGPTATASVYVWNYYLALSSVSGGKVNPANWNLATIFPGVDPSQPISLQAWWATVQPYLQSQGMSGINYPAAYQDLRSRYWNGKMGGWAV